MEIGRTVLLRAVEAVLPAVAKKEVFEQADKVAIIGGRLVAFNDFVLITHPLPGDLDLEGAIDGRRLYALLSKMTGEVVDIRVGEGKVEIRCGRPRASFGLLPVALPVDSVDQTGEMVDLPDGFVDKLKWVSPSCAKDTSRPALTCVLVDGGWMQASDSYRASRVRVDDDLPRLMIQLPQVKVVADYPIKRVTLSKGREWARFETDGGATLCARSMSAAFPDLTHVYDVSGRELQLTEAISEALERARIFSKRDHAVDEEVRISMRPNQITVSSRLPDGGGSFSEVVRCDGTAEEAEFSIHPMHLASALESGTRCVLGERSVKFSGEDWEHIVALKAK